MKARGLTPPPQGPQGSEEWRKWFEWIYFRVPKVETYDVTLSPGSVGANSTKEVTAALAGLATDDIVLVNKPSHTSGIIVAEARVAAKDTLAVVLANVTGASVSVPSETWKVVTVRR